MEVHWESRPFFINIGLIDWLLMAAKAHDCKRHDFSPPKNRRRSIHSDQLRNARLETSAICRPNCGLAGSKQSEGEALPMMEEWLMLTPS
ncbi:hypothetical protein VTI74DRAFT_10076 [Chaetomium olivicolor]